RRAQVVLEIEGLVPPGSKSRRMQPQALRGLLPGDGEAEAFQFGRLAWGPSRHARPVRGEAQVGELNIGVDIDLPDDPTARRVPAHDLRHPPDSRAEGVVARPRVLGVKAVDGPDEMAPVRGDDQRIHRPLRRYRGLDRAAGSRVDPE